MGEMSMWWWLPAGLWSGVCLGIIGWMNWKAWCWNRRERRNKPVDDGLAACCPQCGLRAANEWDGGPCPPCRYGMGNPGDCPPLLLRDGDAIW